MAFDLVSYLKDQIQLQTHKLNLTSIEDKNGHITDLNSLALGKLIDAYRQASQQTYNEIKSQDALYIQQLARVLTTASVAEVKIPQAELENNLTQILTLHINELHQLDQTAQLGELGLKELLEGQTEHLSGTAPDWVWSINNLKQLIGSKKVVEEPVSLEATLKEFNEMVHSTAHDHDQQTDIQVAPATVPLWSKIVEPIIAIVILWVLLQAYCTYVA